MLPHERRRISSFSVQPGMGPAFEHWFSGQLMR